MATPTTNNPLSYVPAPYEQQYYEALFQAAAITNTATINGSAAVAFFSRSKLPVEVLKDIWTVSDQPPTNSLDRPKFAVAVRLIQLLQNGHKAQGANLAAPPGVVLRPAFFEGVSGVSVLFPSPPTQTLPQSQQQHPSPTTQDPYAMTPQQRSRYNDIFPTYEVQKDGFVYGNEAVELFSKSGVAKDQLRDIWDMVDVPPDNRLDRLEFAMAMHLIVCVSKKNLPMPNSLPFSLKAMKSQEEPPSGEVPLPPSPGVASPPQMHPSVVSPTQQQSKDVILLMFDKNTRATKRLTKSGQAEVYYGIRRLKDNTEREVAIKVFHSENAWEECKTELRNLLRLPRHPNVMEVLDFDRLPKPSYIMKFINGGDLWKHLSIHGKFSQTDARDILTGIGCGLDHLHRNDVVHRDLKSPNILLEKLPDNTLRPVLIDLGLGKMMEENASKAVTTGGKGTAYWMAPEMILHREWSTKTDMYALGVIMWEILTGDVPYRNFSDMQAIGTVVNGGRPDLGLLEAAGTTEEQRKLVEDLWSKDPEKRPSASSFLTQVKELFPESPSLETSVSETSTQT